MNKVKYFGGFAFAFLLGVLVMHNLGDFEVANSISHYKEQKVEQHQGDSGNISSNEDEPERGYSANH